MAQDLPGKFAAEPIVLATDAEGRVALLADESERPGFSGGAVVVHELDGAWKKELVKDNAYGTPVVDLEFAADGTAYAWVENDEPNGIAVITRAIDGTWTESLAETGDFVSNRFSIGADGVAVAFGRSIDNQYRLRTLIDGDTTDLGAAASYFVGYAVTPSPAFGLVTDAPPFAAAIQSGESIYVAWPDGDGYGQVFLPETGPKPEDDCDLEPVPAPCPDVTCPYQGAGVEPRDFALARTEDGALWITYVLTHYEQTVGYYEVCPDGECSCVPVFENDQSTVELVLVRVSPLMPTPELLLTLTIPDVSRSVDMRAHGTDLAVGVRVGGPGPFDATYARLLRIDTTLL
ncbi:MAG: hypothetical protein R3A51_10815 [Nannocystaceae bacterium]